MTRLLLAAHGTHSAAGRAVVDRLTADVAARLPGVAVERAWVDVVEPSCEHALAAAPAGEPVVLAPCFLAAGYHVRVDVPAAAATRPDTVVTPHLGADDAVATVLARRVAGTTGPVVLGSAGSSDPRAVAEVHALADELGRRTGREVGVGFASALAPTVGDAVAALGARVVATHLLAPGWFADRMAGSGRAAGAEYVTEPLGNDPELVDSVVRLFCAARRD